MKGRRDNPAHHTVPAEVRDVPEVGMDYCYVRRADCKYKITVFLQKDRDSKAIRSKTVVSKGVKCKEAIEASLRGIREFGHYGKIALRADGENEVKALKGELTACAWLVRVRAHPCSFSWRGFTVRDRSDC